MKIGIVPALKGMALNDSYQVSVREPGGTWHELSVYNVKVGHQEGDDQLRLSVDPSPYTGPKNASLVLFDFDQTVEIRIKYARQDISSFVLSPSSYRLRPQSVGKDTVVFTLTQNREAPRKLVFRPNGDWESECLHLLTNPLETDAPAPSAVNVLAIKPGEDIPRRLPIGKDTYYFMPGVHNLPKGAWVDLDLGRVTTVASFDLATGSKSPWIMPGGIQFRIETRLMDKLPWELAYERLLDPNAFDLRKIIIKPTSARFVRLTILGNWNDNRAEENCNQPHAGHVKQFTLYDVGGNSVSVGRAVAGALPNFSVVTDGEGNEKYGSIYGAETFFIPHATARVYMAPGSLLRGSFGGEGLKGVRIGGRGILDASNLLHAHWLEEGRTSPIRITGSSNITVDGITILDAPMWSVVLNQNQGVRVQNVNIMNSVTNGDGIHFSGSFDAVASGCFMRACDDLFVLYHYGETRDIAFRNCVLWSDGGRIALFGAGDSGDMRNIMVENCDVLSHQVVWSEESGNALSVWPSCGRTIENVTFKNIRFEAVRYPSISGLFQLKTVGEDPGFLRRVHLENIDYPFPGSMISCIMAADQIHTVKDVTLKSIRWGNDFLTRQNAIGRIKVSNVDAPRIE